MSDKNEDARRAIEEMQAARALLDAAQTSFTDQYEIDADAAWAAGHNIDGLAAAANTWQPLANYCLSAKLNLDAQIQKAQAALDAIADSAARD